MATLLSPEELEKVMERKNKMRREAYDRRAAQENKEEVSARAVTNFMALPEYQKANVAMWYIDCRSETRTKTNSLQKLKGAKRKLSFLIAPKMKMVKTNLAFGGWKVWKKWLSASGTF